MVGAHEIVYFSAYHTTTHDTTDLFSVPYFSTHKNRERSFRHTKKEEDDTKQQRHERKKEDDTKQLKDIYFSEICMYFVY